MKNKESSQSIKDRVAGMHSDGSSGKMGAVAGREDQYGATARSTGTGLTG